MKQQRIRSYLIKTDDGGMYRKHHKHIIRVRCRVMVDVGFFMLNARVTSPRAQRTILKIHIDSNSS